MKIMKYIAVLLGCFPFLIGCSNEVEINEPSVQVPLEIKLGGVETRAIIRGTSLPLESKFGIYGTKDIHTYMDNINNICVSYDGQCHLHKNVLLDKSSIYIKAYYPYIEDTEKGEVLVNIKEQADLLYGNGVNANDSLQEINNQNPKANIVFKHALSRITFKVRHTEKIADDFKLIKIYVSQVPELTRFDVISQTFGNKDFGGVSFEINVPVGKENSSFDLLMIPAEANDDRGIEICDSNGKGYWVKLPNVNWESGQQYTYELIFDNNVVTISEAVITPWNSTTETESVITDDNYITD